MKVSLSSTAATTRRKWTKERSERDPTFELLFKNNPLSGSMTSKPCAFSISTKSPAGNMAGRAKSFSRLRCAISGHPKTFANARFGTCTSVGDFHFQHLAASEEKWNHHLRREYLARDRLQGAAARFVCPIEITDRLTAETAKYCSS